MNGRDAAGPGGVVVIGVGNEFRRDDGVGAEVLGRLRQWVPESVALVLSDGEPADLIEAWTGASLAFVVDAVRGDPARPGRVHRLEIGACADDPLAGSPAAGVSSHGLGLGEAIALARALGRMPQRLVVHAVEATEFGFGVGLTPEVAAAADAVATAVRAELGAIG